jgi:hypothetical protein
LSFIGRLLRLGSVPEVHDPVPEAVFFQELELQADIVGQGPFAPSDHDGREKQLTLVDQPGFERVGGEPGTAHKEFTVG